MLSMPVGLFVMAVIAYPHPWVIASTLVASHLLGYAEGLLR